jgi:hypothetical protein
MAMSDTPERAAQGGKERWLQLGMLSATVVAPLIARWRGLRADDRAQALRERAEALREQATMRFANAARAGRSFQHSFQHSLQQSLQRASDRKTIGQTAPDVSEPLAALTLLAALPPTPETAEQAERRRVRRASLWLAGVSAGLIAASAVTYIIIRNRALARAERETLAELALERLPSQPPTTPETSEHPISERPVTEGPPSEEPGYALPPIFSDADAEGANWVGDIFTRAYMPVDALDVTALPTHDRRIYFASEEQAIAAGYHRAGEAPTERE